MEKATSYLQVYELLKAEIESGKRPVFSAMPTRREICEQFGIAQATAGKAFARLHDEGLVLTKRGRRSYVAVPPSVDEATARSRRSGYPFSAVVTVQVNPEDDGTYMLRIVDSGREKLEPDEVVMVLRAGLTLAQLRADHAVLDPDQPLSPIIGPVTPKSGDS